MRSTLRILAPLALAVTVSGCSLGGLLGGGKAPPTLLTLTTEAAPSASLTRAANAGESVTIATPIVPKEIRAIRVPVHVTATDVAYVENLQWVDTPDRLFRDLLAETVRRTTNRVVLDQRQSALDPGLLVSGQLHRFGFDATTGTVIVRFDGALSTQGGTRVETRRFEANVPSTPDAPAVGQALNRAANQVAREAAAWIGG
jgi:cholesterol transport system auxiliary component